MIGALDWRVLLALLLVGAIVLHVSVRAFEAWLRSLRAQSRQARAASGEVNAARWLAELGYEILGAQIVAQYVVWVDREPFTVGLRADYLVQKKGARYVAEVKTGKLAPRIDTPATRRQLLEYRVAFDVDGVLLVDAEAGRVRAITFSTLE